MTHYIVIRTDLPTGLAFAQTTHAAGESGPAEPGTYAIVLAAESEQELLRIADRLEQHAVPVHRVVESSGRYTGQTMALGIWPGPKRERGRYLSDVPLLRFRDLYDCKKLVQMYQQDHETMHQRLLEQETGLQSWWCRLFTWWHRLFRRN